MLQRVNIKAATLSVTLTPLARFARTFTQILIAVGAAIPIVLNTPSVAGNAALAKDLGVAGGLVVIITAVWNALENYGVIPVVGGTPATPIVPTVTASDQVQRPRPIPEL